MRTLRTSTLTAVATVALTTLVGCGGECDNGLRRCQGTQPEECVDEHWKPSGADCASTGEKCMDCPVGIVCTSNDQCPSVFCSSAGGLGGFPALAFGLAALAVALAAVARPLLHRRRSTKGGSPSDPSDS